MDEFHDRPAGADAGTELKSLIAEASQALARLDAGRLEELALSCQALNRMLEPGNADPDARKILAQQARESSTDMAVFARVLDATRANLNVMSRLRELRMGRLEYDQRQARGGLGAEAGHGDH